MNENGSGEAQFATFAVLDLETSNLPNGISKVYITEISIYAFAAETLDTDPMLQATPLLPPLGRVLHKLTLMVNPGVCIAPKSTELTGLDNFMLEQESYFDETTANAILYFLRRLQQPVCLVAHNGWGFDFPTLKRHFEKCDIHLPDDMLCVDSLKAFWHIDEQREAIEVRDDTDSPVEIITDIDNADDVNKLSKSRKEGKASEDIDFRYLNETTPKRPTKTAVGVKRKYVTSETWSTPSPKRTSENFKSRRVLFSNSNVKKRYPPKNVYKLGNMFSRLFLRAPQDSHRAEADIDMLTRLMKHYGRDFLQYAREHAIPVAEVKSSYQ